jgi:hypothetical protein
VQRRPSHDRKRSTKSFRSPYQSWPILCRSAHPSPTPQTVGPGWARHRLPPQFNQTGVGFRYSATLFDICVLTVETVQRIADAIQATGGVDVRSSSLLSRRRSPRMGGQRPGPRAVLGWPVGCSAAIPAAPKGPSTRVMPAPSVAEEGLQS